MFVFYYTLDPVVGGPAGTPDGVVWGESAQMLSAISGGSPVADGGLVALWLADDTVNALDQSVSGQRPIADIDGTFPGRDSLTFQSDRHLTGTFTDTPDTFLLVVGPQGSTARTLLTRDTSQTTTAPAFSVAVEEYFV
jgi:hypothetical protein